MARIRSIKPEITESETLAGLPLAVCWTFACLWPHCDDRGRRKAQPRLVLADLYPMRDDITAEDLVEHLTLLAEAELVCIYTGCDGKPYMHVVNWDEHQKVDRPSKSRIPTCRTHEPDGDCPKHEGDCESSSLVLGEPSSNPREGASTGSRTLDLGPRTVDLGPEDLAPTKSSRKVDEVWDALLVACDIDPAQISGSARGAYNRAAKDLRDVGATPSEIRRRAAVFRGQWRDASLTPTALARRWSECARAPNASPAPSRNSQILDAAEARALAAEAEHDRRALG